MGRRFSETIEAGNNGIIKRGLFCCASAPQTVEVVCKKRAIKNCADNKIPSNAYVIGLKDASRVGGINLEYEVNLAQRRYMNVAPENRLVVDSLEADWNEKIRALDAAKNEYKKNIEKESLH